MSNGASPGHGYRRRVVLFADTFNEHFDTEVAVAATEVLETAGFQVALPAGPGLAYEVLETGCCGLAGSFGYEAGERYRVLVAAGERKLLPAIRAASPHHHRRLQLPVPGRAWV